MSRYHSFVRRRQARARWGRQGLPDEGLNEPAGSLGADLPRLARACSGHRFRTILRPSGRGGGSLISCHLEICQLIWGIGLGHVFRVYI